MVPDFLTSLRLTRPGYKLVSDHSRIIVDLTSVPMEDRELYNDFAHTSIVQAVRRLTEESDLLYSFAIRSDEFIIY